MKSGAVCVVVATLLWAGWACVNPSIPESGADLVELFPLAEAWTESRLVAFGDPAARPFMLWGFSVPEKPGILPFTWATGLASEVGFDVVEPRPLAFAFRGFPFTFAGAPDEQLVAVRLNGYELARVPLAGGSHEFLLHLDPSRLVAGRNRLRFEYSYAAKPSEVLPGSTDIRNLSVGWEYLRLEGTRSFGQPRARASTPPALVLPYRSQIDYAVELRPPSFFAVEQIRPWAGAAALKDPGFLEVEIQTPGGQPVKLRLKAGGPDGRSVPLPVSAGPARVSLRAIPNREIPRGDGGLQLIRPSLRFPPAAVKEAAPQKKAARAECADQLSRPPNIVFYLVDTLRADHLGVYGYRRPTTPEIDAFAREAALFTRFMAQAPYTKPAVASIFTGLQAQSHGVTSAEAALPESAVTLAELLRQKGYETVGIVTNDNVAPVFGFDQGFSTYLPFPIDDTSREVFVPSTRLNEETSSWLSRRTGDRPFFLYLHSSDPHAPYTPRSPFRERFARQVDPDAGLMENVLDLEFGRKPFSPKIRADLLALYDAEIAFNDASFGELLRKLKEMRLYDSTLLIFTADHGEEFYEHGEWEHASNLHADQINVPLIVKPPCWLGGGKRITELAQQVDLLPTVLDFAGVKILQPAQGESLLPAICTEAPLRQREVLSHLGVGRKADSITIDRWKLIWRYDNPGQVASSLELFDLSADPSESRNLANAQPVWSFFLKTLLRGKLASLQPLRGPTGARIDPTLERKLRALGYIR